ncbi:MAG: hypothetical protein FRX49_02902 [Trebouxia sp. A1-2]|nr:MAG: hypothetical protein FRX49_02902 [Trebouxia sp. A1-2]
MASMSAMYDRVLSSQQASTSFCHVANVRPGLYSRKPMRVVAASATQAPAQSVAKVPAVETKEQGGGPGRVFLSSTRAAAGQLWGVLKFFQAEEEAAMTSGTDSNVLGDTAKRAEQAEKVQDKAKAKKQKEPAADISKYLRGAGLMETRYVRMVASLCAQTYYMHKLTKQSLWRRHRLHLVTTSLAFKSTDALKSAQQTLDEGDGMVSSSKEVQTAQQEVISPTKSQQQAQQRAAALATLARKVEAEPKKSKQLNPSELVAQGLAAAAAAAANAAAPFASFGNAVPFRAVTSRMQNAAAAGQSTAIATIATVTAAVSSNFNKEHSKAPKESQAADPTQWFVCDDPVSHTRYFVIQGSETIDHWRVNLSFDPVVFEDKSLGVKVHRGVYVAAEILYERFKPMVEEQLASSPFAKVAFTGHSLGGSLGTLLMMMYKHRGVLPQTAIAPAYTFGAPAIFCEGACCSACDGSAPCSADPTCELSITTDTDSASDASPDTSATKPITDNHGHQKSQGILQALGLEAGCVRNIFMSRDIVPRAFACDYTLVADLLRRVGEGFREHDCLMGNGRVVMYFFVGKMMVLQPDKEHRFIAKDEPYHDMLPAQPGLWVLRQPNVAALSKKAAPSLAAMANGELADAGHAAIQVASKSNGSHAQTKGSHKGKLSKPSTAVMVVSHTRKGKPAASLRDALMDLMNYPHPLDTLGEPSAYGPDGAISRYHNPDHYVRALGGVLRTKTKPMRMGFKSSRWYLHLQEKEQTMKRKVRSMRHAGSESARKQKRQLQMQLQKQHNQQKCQPPPSVLNEWKRASQHLG